MILSYILVPLICAILIVDSSVSFLVLSYSPQRNIVQALIYWQVRHLHSFNVTIMSFVDVSCNPWTMFYMSSARDMPVNNGSMKADLTELDGVVFSVCNGSMLIWCHCLICGCWVASVVEAWISSSKHIFLPPKYMGKNRQCRQPIDPAVCPVSGTSTGLCTQLVPQLRFRSTCSVVAFFHTFATCTRWCEM